MPSLSHAASTPAAELETELRKVMEASAAAWSAGKLDDFMTIYEDAPGTTYISGGKVVKGYANIRAMYGERFGAGKPGQLGALSFELLETRPLGEAHALLLGRYHLQPAEAGKPAFSGLFTLLFHRSQGQWRVINDHTS
jgi:ketosteroid isomerase-like protein